MIQRPVYSMRWECSHNRWKHATNRTKFNGDILQWIISNDWDYCLKKHRGLPHCLLVILLVGMFISTTPIFNIGKIRRVYVNQSLDSEIHEKCKGKFWKFKNSSSQWDETE